MIYNMTRIPSGYAIAPIRAIVSRVSCSLFEFNENEYENPYHMIAYSPIGHIILQVKSFILLRKDRSRKRSIITKRPVLNLIDFHPGPNVNKTLPDPKPLAQSS